MKCAGCSRRTVLDVREFLCECAGCLPDDVEFCENVLDVRRDDVDFLCESAGCSRRTVLDIREFLCECAGCSRNFVRMCWMFAGTTSILVQMCCMLEEESSF